MADVVAFVKPPTDHSMKSTSNFDLKREQIGKSGISVPWLIAASPVNNSHPCSKLSCVETYFSTMSLLGDDQCYNKSINHKSHNKILPQQSTFLCAHTHTHTQEGETCCKNGKLDINHKYKLTLTDPQTSHEVYPHHGNKRLCFLQQISTSKRSHILLQRSTIQIIQ